jgi:membrane protein DedA with SNARE-associated domain
MVLASITSTLTDAISNHGVWAAFLLMAVDALLPVGGELIMVVAGAIAARAIVAHPHLLGHELAAGFETYLVLGLAGTLGYFAGGLVGWWIGRWVGRDVLDRYGRLIHLGPRNMTRAERWFARHGSRAVFLGRLTPLVRSFISIPAGVFEEPMGRYATLTLLASGIWCFGFAGLGWGLGSSYKSIDQVVHVIEVLVVVAVIGAAVAWWRRSRTRARS